MSTTDNQDFCGVYRTYNDEEKTQIKEEYFVINGKKEGIYKLYRENGDIWEEVNYNNGKKMVFINHTGNMGVYFKRLFI